MDSAGYTVTLEEFRLFHGIDRAVYAILVRDLGRNPVECLFIMGLWLWLERLGFYNLISKILPLPPILIKQLADEAVACIKCLNILFPFSSELTEIPLTHSLTRREISLQFFQQNQPTAFQAIQNLVNTVCVPSLSDIMECVKNLTQSPAVGPSHAAASTSSGTQVQAPPSSPVDNSSRSGGDASTSRGRGRANDRTMFVTFSKGYPVSEDEVRQFFTRQYGNCIEAIHMQEVRPNEQSLYARIVFIRPSFIRLILRGVRKAKFTINGKHVWMRKFVPKE